MQPSFSGLFVTCAYLPHTTLPDCVTRPKSLTFTCCWSRSDLQISYELRSRFSETIYLDHAAFCDDAE